MTRHAAPSLCLLVLLFSAFTADAAAELQPLKVMTFNIRFGTADDGENHWDHRKEHVVETVRAFGPDIVGYQEMMPFQETFVLEGLPGYALAGSTHGLEGRQQRAASAQIFWRADRFESVDAGLFHISQTPDVFGGDDWDSNQPRRVEWVQLRERPTGRTLHVFNTHFDHIGGKSKVHGARLMRERMKRIAGEGPVLVLGDFNTKAFTGEPYRLLLAEGSSEPPVLIDTFAAANPNPGWTGTFNKFEPQNQRTARIDWILHSEHFEVESARINLVTFDGRFPSDHHPVEATLSWSEKKRR
ncbi:endonuclease/exonuclease/phosphatase family protein [Phycisphaera mikurensis]|uniref:Endonuclease/exonuclease/phosphatase domain-containing protein n=1 Tax=Phycisphaera mikurensis (strain NBRC 102666 / KCTC 22515 / FYK2301M01) TaxID=1142394 RepID=I0IC23_PHYMF|nr:endonuclease/exonuclease/phosphatase family protein [Phycisphaera mikurensis]MBB6441965.1 endonuclease/exonuclease/phosphatase family metal-dependent hydrolase [Phycisphaera mikurensis]BAM02811.1 hypothetical protein PSMK_06520 [Phycisphaera mikurensis NBRC 102666]